MASPSIVSLVKSYVAALKVWLADVKALASAETSEQGQKAGIGVGLFLGAAFFGVVAFGLLTFGLVYVFVEVVGLAIWLSFLIVAVLYLLIAGVMALIGKRLLSSLTGPTRTIAAIKAGPGFPMGSTDDEEAPLATV